MAVTGIIGIDDKQGDAIGRAFAFVAGAGRQPDVFAIMAGTGLDLGAVDDPVFTIKFSLGFQ